jgi:hypothetical protein
MFMEKMKGISVACVTKEMNDRKRIISNTLGKKSF